MAYEEPQGRAGQTRPAVAPVQGVIWRANCNQCPLTPFVSLWVSAPYFAPGVGNEGAGSLPSSPTQSGGKYSKTSPLPTHPCLGEGIHSQGKNSPLMFLWGHLSSLSQEGRGNSLPTSQNSSVRQSRLTLCRAWAGVPIGNPRRRTMQGVLEMMRTM